MAIEYEMKTVLCVRGLGESISKYFSIDRLNIDISFVAIGALIVEILIFRVQNLGPLRGSLGDQSFATWPKQAHDTLRVFHSFVILV